MKDNVETRWSLHMWVMNILNTMFSQCGIGFTHSSTTEVTCHLCTQWGHSDLLVEACGFLKHDVIGSYWVTGGKTTMKKKLFAWKYTSSLAILKGIFPWFLVFNFLFITSSSYDKCILRWRVLHENKKESLSQNIGLVSWQQYAVAAIIISLGKKERNKKPFVKEKGENGARTSDINSNTAYPHTRACFSLLAITSHTAHHLLLCFPHFIPYTHCVHLFYSQLSCLSLSTSCHQNCLYFMLWSPAIHNSTTSHLKCHFCSLFVCFSVMACLGFTSLWNT